MWLVKGALRVVGLGNVAPAIVLAAALAIVSALGGLWWAIDANGYSRAKSECDSAALKAELQEKQAEVDALNGRLSRSAMVIEQLQKGDAASRDRIAELEDTLKQRPLQSTKPGAKPDASALLDDRCNLTPAGARRGLRQRKPSG